ncbi:class I SAM-dependent methyltransferase [Anianabacter salinae]|uniref:class I SAM-dependent methyltransferase n=1 Tax=Anianabacter salinae TaxID=2851023 RepID=UPI00225E4527|nr:class I SAM-dependent methyltransferase [Anianabacter salinae]MBV0911861.1 class I SAM-dependent methyltransferase [Anianabacter salinae]
MTSALDVIAANLDPLGGLRIIDVGCGSGTLQRALTEAGALWRGLDPAGAGAGIDIGVAEAMPYADASFDAAVCVNALHHVPMPAMDAALREIARVLVPGGRLVVIEPDATGDLSRVLAIVDDETEIRTAAQAALDRAAASGVLHQTRAYRYDRRDSYDGFAAFRDRILAADPARAPAVERHEAALRAAFDAHATLRDGRPGLSQPMSVRLMTVPDPKDAR